MFPTVERSSADFVNILQCIVILEKYLVRENCFLCNKDIVEGELLFKYEWIPQKKFKGNFGTSYFNLNLMTNTSSSKHFIQLVLFFRKLSNACMKNNMAWNEENME